jgi:uncharacterized membrane protein
VRSSVQRWLLTLCSALGLGLSLYLGLLKLFSLPCLGGGGCQAVIHSGYGAVFGIPVGFFAALLWLGALLVPDDTKRRALLGLLAAGSVIFIGIQLFVLRGFCGYCTTHAVVSWVAVAVSGAVPHRAAVAAGLALAVGGFAVARNQVQSAAAVVSPAHAAGSPLAVAPTSLPWLGPLSTRSPALVVSVTCAACLDLMEELSKRSYAAVESGPALFFRTTEQNRELTEVFVAAALATPGSRRDAFLSTTALLLSIKDQALSTPDVAATMLASMVPSSAQHREQARRMLAAQQETLKTAGVADTTPLLVPIGAKPRAFFRIEEIFP